MLGPILALRLGAAFVPVRKQGKLPGDCLKVSYEKEYGTVSPIVQIFMATMLTARKDAFEMQRDAIKPGQNVIVVDDLIATGKTNSLIHSTFADFS